MDELTRKYWIGFGDGKKSVLEDLLRWHDGLADLVAGVRAHATENYNNGWDVIVECFEDLEIALRVVGAPTLEAAIARFEIDAEIHRERIANARIEGGGFWGSVDC